MASSQHHDIVIIGGSLAGLFTAICIQSLPNVSSVTILERYQPQDLQDLGAGIRCNEEANIAIAELAGIPREKYATLLTRFRSLDTKDNIVAESKSSTWATTWGQLYRVFRKNFDADSKCVYRHGCTLVGLSQAKDGKVQVEYQNGEHEVKTMLADIVIGADGASSKVRALLDVNGSKRTSVGYVCYRGLVRKQDITPAAYDLLEHSGTFLWSPASHFITYDVPTNGGPADQVEKCINWVWYRNRSEEQLRSLMTDTDGILHKFTLSHGKMRAEEVQFLKDEAHEELSPSCIEIIEKTDSPFVQVVTDSMASRASFFDGKLFLVGDAVGGQRPHTASANLQNAHHAILVRQHLEGKIDASKVEEGILDVSRILVEGGQELGKMVMGEAPRGPTFLPTYMKAFLAIQTQLNELWKENIGIGDATPKM